MVETRVLEIKIAGRKWVCLIGCIWGILAFPAISMAQPAAGDRESVAPGMSGNRIVFLAVENRQSASRIETVSSAVALQLDILDVAVQVFWQAESPSRDEAVDIAASTGAMAVFWCDFENEYVFFICPPAFEVIERPVAGMNPETIAMVLQGAVQALLPDASMLPASPREADRFMSDLLESGAPRKSNADVTDVTASEGNSTTDNNADAVDFPAPQVPVVGYSVTDGETPPRWSSSRRDHKKRTRSKRARRKQAQWRRDRVNPSRFGTVVAQMAYVADVIHTMKKLIQGMNIGIATRIRMPLYVGLSYTIEQELVQDVRLKISPTSRMDSIRVRLQNQYLGVDSIFRTSRGKLDFAACIGLRWIYAVYRMDSASALIEAGSLGTRWQFALVPGGWIGMRLTEMFCILVALEARIFVDRAQYVIRMPDGDMDALVPWRVQPAVRVGFSVDFD
jgi:hypothetical protein